MHPTATRWRQAEAEPRPRRRSSVKHAAILDAATVLVARLGYFGTTIEGIAALAGVGKQTIYRWWPSKSVLFIEVYNSLVPRSEFDIDTGNLVADLNEHLQRLFQIYRNTPSALILGGLHADALHDPDVAETVLSDLRPGRRPLLNRHFELALQRGELPPDFDMEWAVELIVALIGHRMIGDSQNLTDAFAERLVKTALEVGRSPRIGAVARPVENLKAVQGRRKPSTR